MMVHWPREGLESWEVAFISQLIDQSNSPILLISRPSIPKPGSPVRARELHSSVWDWGC